MKLECEHCGKPFYAKRSDARFCGVRCRQRSVRDAPKSVQELFVTRRPARPEEAATDDGAELSEARQRIGYLETMLASSRSNGVTVTDKRFYTVPELAKICGVETNDFIVSEPPGVRASDMWAGRVSLDLAGVVRHLHIRQPIAYPVGDPRNAPPLPPVEVRAVARTVWTLEKVVEWCGYEYGPLSPDSTEELREATQELLDWGDERPPLEAREKFNRVLNEIVVECEDGMGDLERAHADLSGMDELLCQDEDYA